MLLAMSVVVAVAGCGTLSSSRSPHRPQGIQLTATLASPVDIVLKWQDPDKTVAGHTIEYASDTNGAYIILGFLPPDQTSFTHSNLMPQTSFFYRVRPFYGPASAPIDLSLPEGLSDEEYRKRFLEATDYGWAAPQTYPSGVSVRQASIRNAATSADATPSDLRAEPVPIAVSGFRLTWKDLASDEEGYLLEIKPPEATDFSVCALLPPDINAFGYVFSPPARKASLRVRAFYYGPPSNIAGQTTGVGSHH